MIFHSDRTVFFTRHGFSRIFFIMHHRTLRARRSCRGRRAADRLPGNRSTPTLALVAFSLLTVTTRTAVAQWSGFASFTGGYQSNPLYNYQNHGDQVYSTFLDLGYARRSFSVRYLGGLTSFNQLSERNYLEHGFTMNLTLRQGHRQQSVAHGDSSEEQGSEPTLTDSLGTYSTLGTRVTARHDRKTFQEYDNWSAALTGTSFHGFASPSHVRIGGEAGYRAYPSLGELSNMTGLVNGEWGFGRNAGTSGGGRVFGGARYYTSATYDTTLFVTHPGNQNGRKNGSGKGGAGVGGSSTVTKQVLSNADDRHVVQIAAGLFLRQAWSGGSAKLSGDYRTNISGAARILARTSENPTINEDIYNDFFSYEGPEFVFSILQTLPFNVRMTMGLSFVSKRFASPAFDLEGNETAATRKDQHAGAEASLARYLPLTDAVGFELAISGYLVRNASNDRYNDFHAWGLSASIGAGF